MEAARDRIPFIHVAEKGIGTCREEFEVFHPYIYNFISNPGSL
jgi:hypothetical protein